MPGRNALYSGIIALSSLALLGSIIALLLSVEAHVPYGAGMEHQVVIPLAKTPEKDQVEIFRWDTPDTKKEDAPARQRFIRPIYIPPTGYKPPRPSALSRKGERLFARMYCANCHAIAGRGGILGPPLDGIGAHRGREFLVLHLKDPGKQVSQYPDLFGYEPSRMPHPRTSADQVRALVAYLLSLPEPKAGFLVNPHNLPEAKPAGDTGLKQSIKVEDKVQSGLDLFLDRGCAACHSIGEVGGSFGPCLNGIFERRSEEFIMDKIGGAVTSRVMPRHFLTVDEVKEIAAFLKALPKGNCAP